MDTRTTRSHRLLQRLSEFVVLAACTLLFVPFSPSFPIPSLDGSWQYAMNEAIAQRLVFGHDLVFTYGPLAPVSTHMYHPATDASMMSFGLLFALALFGGCVFLSRGKSAYPLLGLPFFMPQIGLPDAFFLFLPFVLLLLVTRWTAGGNDLFSRRSLEIALVGSAVALLPLVKASFTGPAAVCGGLALILIAQRSLPIAALCLVCGAAFTSMVWVLLGQPLEALPGFFLTQLRVASGYTEGMSLKGPQLELLAFAVVATVIVKTFSTEASAHFGRISLAPALGLGFVLFVAFKGGFVRHDVHAIIAGSSLLFGAYFSFLTFRTRRTMATLLFALVVWGAITHRWRTDLSPSNDLARLTTAFRHSAAGLYTRVRDGETLRHRFTKAQAEIRQALPLPPAEGTVDLYPSELSAILAHGQAWAPRPVLQSYSAYTPALMELNRKHLASAAAADRIYFSISPIDNHYPAMEDGASWIELMSRYRIGGFTGRYAILEKRRAPVPVEKRGGLVDTQDVEWGRPIRIPSTALPVWAEIDVAPSILGRIYSALFKLPPLRLDLEYEGGPPTSFRFKPGMGRGFLLSPTVETAAAFAALQSAQYENYFEGRRPVSLEIATKLHIQRLLWKSRYAVRLSTLKVPRDDSISSALLNREGR